MDTKSIKNLQKKIQGKVFSEKIIRDFYSVDSSSYKIRPKLVIVPKNTKDVSIIVKFASLRKIPITTRGAGTGLVGGALGSGIILDMKEFSKIQIKSDSVIVGAGVQKGKLDSVLKKHGKFLGPNPSIGPYCAIGGMISANASGSKSLKYGSIIDNLLQVEIILANGKKIKLPDNKLFGKKIIKLANNLDKKKIPKVTKNSCGYRLDAIKDLSQTHKVIAGSEGTLGIIISAKLKIFKEPTKKTLCIIGYDSVFAAAKNCISIKETQPCALEFVDYNTLKNFNHKFSKKTKCLLFVEYDDNLKLKLHKLKNISLGKQIIKTSKENEILKWWHYRDSSLTFSLKLIAKEERAPHIIEDATVPIERLVDLFKIINKIKSIFPCKIIIYGHAGNGNLHVRLISKNKNMLQIRKVASYYFNEVIKIGGTITGEHGDGLARSEFVESVYGQKNFKIFIKTKRLFDKKNILNPSKVISKKNTMLKHIQL